MSLRRRVDEATLAGIAESLGAVLVAGDVVLLLGEMGAGKTTFVRALARGLGVARPDRVASPTYAMIDVHEGPVPLVHVDLHRVTDRPLAGPVGTREAADQPPGRRRLGALGGALEALGLEHDELVAGHTGGVVAVEWGDLWAAPPPARWEIHLSRPRGELSVRDLFVTAVGSAAQERCAAWATRAAKIA
jgi:tRNA A37 threonylcarbamoyladenosine biosynthesis protein TsaE